MGAAGIVGVVLLWWLLTEYLKVPLFKKLPDPFCVILITVSKNTRTRAGEPEVSLWDREIRKLQSGAEA